MSCTHPFKAFKTGFKTVKGKDDFVMFSSGCDDCVDYDIASRKKRINLSYTSYHFRNGHIFLDDPTDIPCGSCVGCRLDLAKEWKVRNCLEAAFHQEKYFITLTYDDEHLPINENGEPYLEYDHMQRFFKRLRKVVSFRYFGIGEYGDLQHRPHWHLLFYGHLDGFKLYAPNQFTSELLSKEWFYGKHIVEQVTPGSVSYVSGYCEKKQIDPDGYEFPVKPFRFMSRKPGIGMAYLEEHKQSVEDTKKVYGRFSESLKATSAPLPSAFKRKLSDEAWMEEYKEAAKLAGMKMEELDKVVYGIKERYALQDRIERGLYETVQRFRKDKL